MARQYERAPLVEAICEFKFASSEPQDWTIPGLLYEAIRSDFPIKEQIGLVQVMVDVGTNQVAQQTQPQMRFATTDKTELVQVAPDVISIHQLHPYKGWVHFRERILEMLAKYRSIAEPERVTRIGLRYVNRIELPPGRHELDDYFRAMPQAPVPIPQVFAAFLEQIQIQYDAAPDGPPESWLRLTFGTAPPEASPGHLSYVLDLDMYTPDNTVPSMDHLADWLETAHGRIEEAFEACFTPRIREEVFREVHA